jgi:hypothetical protein
MNRQALGLSETLLGEDHPHTLTSMANLVSIYWNQRRWDESENLERSIPSCRLSHSQFILTFRVLQPKMVLGTFF